jgi:site-specific recombinase XerD
VTARRPRINRVLSRAVPATAKDSRRPAADSPRQLGGTVIDFSTLHLPPSVSCALAEAFWNQVSARSEPTVRAYWYHLRVFGRFVAETQAVGHLNDVDSVLLVRYVEWLNRERGQDGVPWSKGTRYSTYTTLRTLLRWLQRCRPDLLGEIEFPANPFPWKNRDAGQHKRLPVRDLRAILKACEQDITDLRVRRDKAEQEMARARASAADPISTLGGLLLHIDQHYGGIVPPRRTITGSKYVVARALDAHGGNRGVEPYLYPRAESLFPYYLLILIHAAGNPEAILALEVDCLQPIPLLDDRELLVWEKRRADTQQRRSFRSNDTFEPPTLIRELMQWTRRLRAHVPAADRSHLFIFKGHEGVTPLSLQMAKIMKRSFSARHHLAHFTFASIRPSVLTAFYRVTGDLRQVKEIANHAHLSTTVGYVQGSEVQTQNRMRVAALQSAFIGHIERPSPSSRPSDQIIVARPQSAAPRSPLSGAAVSMFGFNCKDAFAGVAPGTRAGELCTHFLGCFTCPNAIITADAGSLARLLQARDHLQAASGYLHPARWEAIYAPQLRILQEDILTRFSGRELAAAAPLRGTLPSLPELR